MLLKIDNLCNIRLIHRCRDADCELGSSINVLIVIDDVLWRTFRCRLWRRRFKVVRFRLAILIVIILSVVAVVAVRWCDAARRTLLLVSDYRFVDHCDACVAATDCHRRLQDPPGV